MLKNAVIFTLSVLIAFALGFLGGKVRAGSAVEVQTDTCVVRDTIVENKPIYVERWRIRTDTVRLAAVRSDTVEVWRLDTVAVEVPVEMRRYTGENYDLAVSGYRPELEWVKVFPATVTVTRTAGRSRWSFGAVVGPSVLLTPSGKLYGGIGVSAGVAYRF